MAFSAEGENEQEDLYILFERDGMPESRCERLARQISTKVARDYGFAPHLVKAVDERVFARTKTGKVQRLKVRDGFLRDRREETLAGWRYLPEAERQESIERYLHDEVADLLGCDAAVDLEPDAKFLELGLDDQGMSRLRQKLAARVPGGGLSATLLFEYPTIASLTEALMKRLDANSDHGG